MLAKPMRLRPSLTATASLHRAPVRRGCLFLLAGILLAGAAHSEPAESLDNELGQTGDEPLDLSTPLPEIKHTPKLKAAMPGLVTPWDAKVGVNYRKAPVPNAEFLPSPLPDSTPPDQSTGVGWANLTTSRVPLGWDKATIETQVDPLDEQSKLGTTLSRSMPLGDELSLTLQNGLSVSRAFANSSVSSQATSSARTWSSEQALRFNLLPTDTTLSLGAQLSSSDDKWRPTLSAEQKLFGGPISLTGSVSETPAGETSKSLKAGFKQNW
jgi:hypothetical protein